MFRKVRPKKASAKLMSLNSKAEICKINNKLRLGKTWSFFKDNIKFG